ncbi:MAG: arsenate reductase family protein [Coprobacillus sp.]|jgi:arsenate reductase|nr:arsenate reductase family protein [Coprobacillus sp.]
MEFIWYPRCSTCIKANKHLLEKHLTFTTRHIVEQTPSLEELKNWIQIYNQGIKPFFNTSGQVYRQLGLKDKINDMSIDEAVKLLASNGMLIKRPLLILDDHIIIGYKKEIYEQL